MRDYCVVPMFWGKTFPHGTDNPFNPAGPGIPAGTEKPYLPDDFTEALRSIAGSGYFSKLHQYGAENVSILPPIVSTDSWPVSDTAYYVATFTKDQVVSFIKRHMSEATLPEGTIPIFSVILPQGSLLNVHAGGEHDTFQIDGQSYIWFWAYGSNSIVDVCQVATHEIVESIGADFGAPAELCDDCQKKNPQGRRMDNGLAVETYYDASTQACVAPGSSWSPQQDGLGGGTSVGPALAVYHDRLYAAWKGSGADERIFWSSFDGNRWSAQQPDPGKPGLDGGTSVGPALAVYHDRLYAAWKGMGGDQRMFWSSFDGTSWLPQQGGLGGGTSVGPALAVFDGLLYAAWKGSGADERIFWSSFDGNRWSAQQPDPGKPGLDGGTSVGPALAVYHDRLYAAWKGMGGDQRMFWSSFDGTSWLPQQGGLGGGTSVGPALAVFDGLLYAAWKGSGADERMFWSTFGGDGWSPQQPGAGQPGLGGGTSVGPKLAVFQDQLYAAWKGAGTDQRMFWSSRS